MKDSLGAGETSRPSRAKPEALKALNPKHGTLKAQARHMSSVIVSTVVGLGDSERPAYGTSTSDMSQDKNSEQ